MATRKCKIISGWTIVFLLVLLMVAQGVFLDQYFYNYYKQVGWKFLIYAYLPAVGLLLWQQMVETFFEDHVQSTEQEEFDRNSTTFAKLLRLITGYHKMFTWFLYVIPSVVQYVWILNTFVEDIESSSFYGPRFLRVILCFPSGVFLLLDTIEYAVKPELNVEWWRVFDLFDTVELLQILLVDRSTSLPINQTTKTFMLIFGSISLCFPAFSLWELQACRKIPSQEGTAGSNKSSTNERTRLVSRVRIVSKVCQLLLVNIAFLVLRVILFFKFNLDASVFVVKNVIAMTVGAIEIVSAFRGKRIKRSQGNRNTNLEETFQNPAHETSDGARGSTLTGKITTTRSTQTVDEDFPNHQQKTIKPEQLSSNDLNQRSSTLYRDPEKLLTDPFSSMLDGISFDSNTSETSLGFPTKMTESRSQKMPRLAGERFQNPPGYTKSVIGDPRFCSSRDTEVPESDQLSSAFQKTVRQEQRFRKQNPPRKFDSGISSPRVTEAKESKSIFSALQQTKTREHEHSKTQTPLRESPVSLDPCGDSKRALSSDIHLSSTWQQRAPKHGERSNVQNLRSEKPAFGGDQRVRFNHNTRIKELNHSYSTRLRTATKQEESCSEMKNSRRGKPAAKNPKVQLSFNTRSESYNSSPLDRISAENDTSEIHLGFANFNSGPKRFSETPETESAQYKRHQSKGDDSRRSGRNMHTQALTVWNTRN